MDVKWDDLDQVVAYANKLTHKSGLAQVVFRRRGQRTYNITHVSRTDRYMGHDVLHITKAASK